MTISVREKLDAKIWGRPAGMSPVRIRLDRYSFVELRLARVESGKLAVELGSHAGAVPPTYLGIPIDVDWTQSAASLCEVELAFRPDHVPTETPPPPQASEP